MSKDKDIYQELLQLWQNKLQEFWRDPRVMEAMLGGYGNAHEGMNAFYGGAHEHSKWASAWNNGIHPNDGSANASQTDDVLVSLRNAILELNARIAALEGVVAELRSAQNRQ